MPIKIFVSLLAFGMLCVAGPIAEFESVSAQAQKQSPRKALKYACPMHPDVVSTRRGKCPKCGMKLRLTAEAEKVETADASVAPSADPSSFASARIPNIEIFDQNGKARHFYTDLIKDKTVAINFIFTTCTTICPSLTATFRKVQQELALRGVNAQLISVSVDPGIDTPERLHEFAVKFKAGPGWTFVTGKSYDIDALLQSLGVAFANKNDHTPMILVGSDTTGRWTRTYGLSAPPELVKIITSVAK